MRAPSAVVEFRFRVVILSSEPCRDRCAVSECEEQGGDVQQ